MVEVLSTSVWKLCIDSSKYFQQSFPPLTRQENGAQPTRKVRNEDNMLILLANSQGSLQICLDQTESGTLILARLTQPLLSAENKN